MKLNKLVFMALVAVSFFGSSLLSVKNVSAAGACDNADNSSKTACTTGDGHSSESGICFNHICTPTGTTVTTPTPGVGSTGQITSTKIPGTTEGSGIISCGRPGQDMCTICNLIEGMNNIIQYLMKIAIGVALLAFSIGGIMYVVSAGDTGLIDNAKSTMKNAAIGFVIIFAGWLIINTTITYIGTKSDMGIGVTSWGQFNCNRTVPVSN